MKKRLFLLAPLALTGLIACGENDVQEEEKTGTEIIMWHNSNDTTAALLGNFVTAFQDANPGITVKLSKETGDYNQILKATLTGLTADNYPDLFLGYPDSVSQIMDYGKVVNLDKYMKDPEVGWTEDDFSDIPEAYIKEGQNYQVEGTYSLPYAKSTEAMYYNKILIGLDLSAQDATINGGQPLTEAYINNLTWEELFGKLCPAIVAYNDSLDASSKIWLPNDKGYESIVSWSSDANAFITLCEQYGYDYTKLDTNTGKGVPTFNNDNNKALLKKFYEAHAKKYFTTYKAAGGSYTNSMFTKKQVLFDIGSTGGGQYYSGSNNTLVDFKIAKIPHAEGKAPKVINQGPSLAILKHNDDRALAAWKFYKFITNPKNADAFARTTGYSPIRYSVYETDDWAEYASEEGKASKTLENTYAQIANYVPKVANDLYSSPVFNGSATCRTQVDGLMGNILNMKSWSDDEANKFFESAYQTSLLAC